MDTFIKNKTLTDFAIGLIIGFAVGVIIMSLVLALAVNHYENKERIEYAERQIEVEQLREDYSSRDFVEFLELPSVRGAADRGNADFDRRREEILQRFRNEFDNRSVDRSGSRGD
jgi:hypothetical protein